MNGQAEALARLAGRETGSDGPAPRRAFSIAIASGKGGVGKSTIATNLALAVAEAGRETVLVDGDFALGQCDVLLGLAPEHRIDDVLAGAVEVTAALAPVAPRLTLLAAARGMVGLADPAPAVRTAIASEMARVARGRDVSIIDLPSGISRTTLELAAGADMLLVVMTPEPAAVADAYALVKILALRRTSPTFLVLNRVTPGSEPHQLLRRLHRITDRFLKQKPPVIGALEEDPRVAEAAFSMTPLLTFAPRTRAAVSMRRMARKLLSIGTSEAREQGFVAR